jgi:hypothetical protein
MEKLSVLKSINNVSTPVKFLSGNGWLFSTVSDYMILEKDSLICILGYASGTYMNLKNKDNSNFWKIPVALKAIVKDNHIMQWQIYADNLIVMDIINRNK